jgi:hypothetical protein
VVDQWRGNVGRSQWTEKPAPGDLSWYHGLCLLRITLLKRRSPCCQSHQIDHDRSGTQAFLEVKDFDAKRINADCSGGLLNVGKIVFSWVQDQHKPFGVRKEGELAGIQTEVFDGVRQSRIDRWPRGVPAGHDNRVHACSI